VYTILACRNVGGGNEAVKDLISRGYKAEFRLLDIHSTESIQSFSDVVLQPVYIINALV
jgi:hypothetical protein